MILHRYPQDVWQKESSYAKSCINVLDHCAKVDTLALRFAEVARGYYQNLTARAHQDKAPSNVDVPNNPDHLFGILESSPPDLEASSRDLLELIRCPFGYSTSLYSEGSRKSGLATQLERSTFNTLPFNRNTPKNVNCLALLKSALPGIQCGKFIGSSRPHGWDSISNLDEL
jgi:hypothetical protein